MLVCVLFCVLFVCHVIAWWRLQNKTAADDIPSLARSPSKAGSGSSSDGKDGKDGKEGKEGAEESKGGDKMEE